MFVSRGRVDGSLMGSGITSWLHIARAAVTDSGNYTCRAGEVARADVRVHVLDGRFLTRLLLWGNLWLLLVFDVSGLIIILALLYFRYVIYPLPLSL